MVILVIALFLHNATATLIPALALPFSLLGTLSVIYALGFSLNSISMMALILSVGFVVDDAIVMLENIVRHIEKGETPHGGFAPGIARDLVHDSFDDDLAGGGLHSDSVHGRHSRKAVPRVCDHRSA